MVPTKVLPKPQGDVPTVYGVSPAYAQIASLQVTRGRFFDEADDTASAAVAVLGQAAAAGIFGALDPLDQFVKVNQQWFRIIGIAGPQMTVQSDVAGLPSTDRNNLIYVPIMSAMLRLEDSNSWQKDEIDAVYLNMKPDADVVTAGAVVRGLLDVFAPRRDRLQRHHPGRAAGAAAAHQAAVRDRHGRDRVDLVAGRRASAS
jgi:putative ABC transport system permease protein